MHHAKAAAHKHPLLDQTGLLEVKCHTARNGAVMRDSTKHSEQLMCLMLYMQGSASQAAAANLSMSVTIQGLGPRFRLLLNLSNEGSALVNDLQVGVAGAAVPQ